MEERREQEDAGESEVADRRDGSAFHGWVEADVEADDEHGEALGDGGPEEGPTATEGVGGEEEKGSAGYHFYDAVDAGCEEAFLGFGDTEVEEDEGSIVVDCVAGWLLV